MENFLMDENFGNESTPKNNLITPENLALFGLYLVEPADILKGFQENVGPDVGKYPKSIVEQYRNWPDFYDLIYAGCSIPKWALVPPCRLYSVSNGSETCVPSLISRELVGQSVNG